MRWNKHLIGKKFTTLSTIQLQQTISRQTKRLTKKRDEDKKVLPKTRVTVQDLYVTMTKFMEETNQKMDHGFEQINARIDNLVVKNKLVE